MNKGRRLFLNSIACMSSLRLLFVGSFFSSSSVRKAMIGSSFSEETLVSGNLIELKVTTLIPEGKSPSDYHIESAKWLDPKYYSLFEVLEKKSLIMEKSMIELPDRIERRLYFSSREALQAYHQLISQSKMTDVAKREALGYRVLVSESLVSKDILGSLSSRRT